MKHKSYIYAHYIQKLAKLIKGSVTHFQNIEGNKFIINQIDRSLVQIMKLLYS